MKFTEFFDASYINLIILTLTFIPVIKTPVLLHYIKGNKSSIQ